MDADGLAVLEKAVGLLLLPLAAAYIRLQGKFNDVQEDRVKDAQKIVDKLLGVQQSIDRNTNAVDELRKDFQRGKT